MFVVHFWHLSLVFCHHCFCFLFYFLKSNNTDADTRNKSRTCINNCVLNIFLKLLISLCDLRGTHQFPYISKLERAVGMAVQKMGPRYNYLNDL